MMFPAQKLDDAIYEMMPTIKYANKMSKEEHRASLA